MKRLLFLILTTVGLTSSAVELGLVTTSNLNSHTTGQGITLGEKFGDFGITVGYNTSVGSTGLWQHKTTVMGNYRFYQIDNFAFNIKLGIAHIEKQHSQVNGDTPVFGLGSSYQVAPRTKLTLDLTRQQSNSSMSVYNSNSIAAGIKVEF